MDENERRRIEGLPLEEFDRELFTRFGVKPRLQIDPSNPHGYDLDFSTRPEPNTEAFSFFSAGTFLRGLDYCHYLHSLGRY